MKNLVLPGLLVFTCSVTSGVSMAVGAESKQSICKKISDRAGIYFSDDENASLRKLHGGTQNLRRSSAGRLFFVVGENDGRAETVDHFRVITTNERNARTRDIELNLDRSPAKSPCNRTWFGLGTYSRDFHGRTTSEKFNRRLHPDGKNVDNKLNAWHFMWNVGQGAKHSDVVCDATARLTPSIGSDAGRETPGNGFIGPAVAAVMTNKSKLPANVKAVRMVLVHRKENENACLGVNVGSSDNLDQTRIQRLRFGNNKVGFSGSAAVIEWTN